MGAALITLGCSLGVTLPLHAERENGPSSRRITAGDPASVQPLTAAQIKYHAQQHKLTAHQMKQLERENAQLAADQNKLEAFEGKFRAGKNMLETDQLKLRALQSKVLADQQRLTEVLGIANEPGKLERQR